MTRARFATKPGEGVMRKSAILSPCGLYRYRLTRGVGDLLPVVMLNPSTADADVDDPTIRRLLGFAQNGLRLEKGPSRTYDGIDVVNLYGLRSTNPRALRIAPNPFGPENHKHHAAFVDQYRGDIVVAWGANALPNAVERFFRVFDRACPDTLLTCFGTTTAGHPRHPLYIPYSQYAVPFFR